MNVKQAGWLYTSPSGRTHHAAPLDEREQSLCDEGWTETPLYSADTIAALRAELEEEEAVREKIAKLLAETVVVLRGLKTRAACSSCATWTARQSAPPSDASRGEGKDAGACWLIETSEQPPRYWSAGRSCTWSHSPGHAVRFKRADDAHKVMQWARLTGLVDARPVEHVWMDCYTCAPATEDAP